MSTDVKEALRGLKVTDEAKRAGANRSGQSTPVAKRNLKISQMFAKTAGGKGGRPAAHGHSRHK